MHSHLKIADDAFTFDNDNADDVFAFDNTFAFDNADDAFAFDHWLDKYWRYIA